MLVQLGESKKFIEFDLDIKDDLEFYLNEVIAGVTNDEKFNIDTYSTFKLLFYHF